ncbi:methyltransferase domain-containing protein [Embleya hyalina]|uniref:Protein-L-isoaspartate O-methyltransferase n=1 Tax=Embleya hyalina TaxID=516124 RepID=A0A401YX37_9ACTN|nr:methyltransferase domain-containing protein [Embleya hyalina]GCD99130.1 protein-L-isoaspartate O-methyltransferase [Embleya hyalina]
MTDVLEERRRALDEAMRTRGAWPEDAPWVRDAFDALPRHAFAPDRLWDWDGNAYVPVDRSASPGRWAELVYAGPDDAAVTEITDGLPSSSLSAPAVVATMLDSLDVHPGHHVLELGTGTGWNAALIAHRVGTSGRVTSVEASTGLADAAARALNRAGARVDVAVGNGNLGRPATAPHDRVIATYAVDHVPWTWIAQTVPGGDLVFPLGRMGHFAVTVADDHRSARGWMHGLAQFMNARDIPAPAATVRSYTQVRAGRAPDDKRGVDRDITPLHTDVNLLWALRMALPDVVYATDTDRDGVNAWIHDGTSSWAVVTTEPDGGARTEQGGPRRLFDAVETAWDAWTAHWQVSRWDHGITLTEREQYVWEGDPDTGRRHRLPSPGST